MRPSMNLHGTASGKDAIAIQFPLESSSASVGTEEVSLTSRIWDKILRLAAARCVCSLTASGLWRCLLCSMILPPFPAISNLLSFSNPLPRGPMLTVKLLGRYHAWAETEKEP